MRILVLSTPRTGSVALSEALYSHYLTKCSEMQHLGEFLNPLHYGLYFEEVGDVRRNHQEFANGRYWINPLLNRAGQIIWERIPAKHNYIDKEETTYKRLELLSNIRGSFILHHHVFTHILASKLIEEYSWDKIYYSFREDRLSQILSYGIAYAIKQFKYTENKVLDIPYKSLSFPPLVLDSLIQRLKEADKITFPDHIRHRVEYVSRESLKPIRTHMREVLSDLGLKDYVEMPHARVSVETPYNFALEDHYTSEALAMIKEKFNSSFTT